MTLKEQILDILNEGVYILPPTDGKFYTAKELPVFLNNSTTQQAGRVPVSKTGTIVSGTVASSLDKLESLKSPLISVKTSAFSGEKLYAINSNIGVDVDNNKILTNPVINAGIQKSQGARNKDEQIGKKEPEQIGPDDSINPNAGNLGS